MVICCSVIVLIIISALIRYWYQMCCTYGFQYKRLGDLPVIKYENFVSFYNVSPSTWELKDARVVKKDVEAEEKRINELASLYKNEYSRGYIYSGWSYLDEDRNKLSFRFTFLDYWKYKIFLAKENKKIHKKEMLEKERKDMEELSNLVNAVKYDISKMKVS